MKKSLGPEALLLPAPAWVICTYDSKGKPNAMTVAWAGICCSRPPSVAIALRKATYTYSNLIARKAFTVNIASETFVREVDFFGLSTGAVTDKFAATNLTPSLSSLVDAPYIEEFPLVFECQVTHVTEIGLHTQFIGEILDVKAEPGVLGPDDLPRIEQLRPLIYSAVTRTYHGVGGSLGQAFVIGSELEV
jgi:flavin reductase (DIM6/NTAB) family NADH-FMN oxidoreductase RutF